MSIEPYVRFARSLPEPILLLSGDGTILSANDGLATRLGLEPTALRGRRLGDAVVDPPDQVARYLRSCARSRQVVVGSLRLAAGGGEPIACRAEGAVLVPGSDGEPPLILLRLTARDTRVGEFVLLNRKLDELAAEIARRLRTEAELREQREWFRTTLGSIGDAVIATDTQGHVLFMNAVAEALTGWSQDDAAGRILPDVFRIRHERTGRPVENPVTEVLRQGSLIGMANHTVLQARDGRLTPIDDSGAPIRSPDGRIDGVVVVFRDVTERKRAQNAMARLAAIVESTDDAVLSVDTRGEIATWNPAAERLFGHASKDVLGQSIHLLTPVDYMPEAIRVFEQIRRGEPVSQFETVQIGKGGRPIDVALTISPLADDEGELIGASIIARDITERKRTEAAQVRTERRKDEFLAMLAHELRNPLAPMTNALKLLKMSPASGSHEIEWSAEILERQLRHMTRLVDDLLDLSRIRHGKIELQREVVDLNRMLAQAVESARASLAARPRTIATVSPLEPVLAHVDPIRIEQVLGNLLSNAARYTEDDGRIDLELVRDGDQARITVRDDGIGIAADVLPSVFDLFVQADRPLARSQGGLGIGLTLVRTLAQLHGGRVEARSAGLGLGSEFSVWLPLAIPADAGIDAPPRAADAPEAARPCRVLLVDDNLDGAQSLARLLSRWGHEVRLAHDGAGAIDAIDAFAPEVLLLDIGLPLMDGYEVARRIRREPRFDGVQIFALTGYGQDADRERALRAGFNLHLVKPIDPDRLRSLLAEIRPAAGAVDPGRPRS